MSNRFDPSAAMLGGYQPLDGTIEFYGRISAILRPTDTVLDLGAGRGAWYFEDRSAYRRAVRELKSKVNRVIGVDVDDAVLSNPTTTENILAKDGRIPLPDASVDVVVADYVLEHVRDPTGFCAEIARVLVDGGHFCARTPHKYCYVAIAARCVRNSRHRAFLSIAQPGRKAEDVFPTSYRLNTLRNVRRHFVAFENFSYLYASEPQYYFGSRVAYWLLRCAHKLLPSVLVSNIFIFARRRSR